MRPVERLMRIAQRIGSWRAPLVFGAFAMSLPAYALVFANSQAASPLLPGAVASLVYRLAVLGLAVCPGGMVVRRKQSRFRYLLAVSFFVTLFLIVAYRLRVETVAILTLASTVWAFLYQPYPASIVLSSPAAVALPAAGLLAEEYGILTAATLAMTSAAAAILGTLLIRAREHHCASDVHQPTGGERRVPDTGQRSVPGLRQGHRDGVADARTGPADARHP